MTYGQLGCYARFPGVSERDTADFAARGMRVAAVPKAEGFEWDARRNVRAVDTARRVRPQFVVTGGDMTDDDVPKSDGGCAEIGMTLLASPAAM